MAVKPANQSEALTSDMAAAAKSKVDDATLIVASLDNFTENDVPSFIKMDPKKEAFVRDVIVEMKNAKGKIPTAAELDIIIGNLTKYDDLYDLEDVLKELYTKIRRNRMNFGSVAYRESLTFYGSLEPVLNKIAGAIDIKKRLMSYFKNNSSGGTDKKPPKDDLTP